MDVNSRRNKIFSRARALVFALALAVASGIGFGFEQPATAQQAQLPTPQDLSRTFIEVAKQVKPAVVHIEVEQKSNRTSRRQQVIPQIPGFPPFDDAQPRRQQGSGSGVIISSDGFILTNNHVAGDADVIKVKLADGRELKARRVGTDPETDLAVIKIDEQNLPFARLGNSDALEQGEWVIALGSPFGLQQTMTAGIVSATGRDLPGAGPFVNYIQTDASINPGNSGGPLVNMQGEVIGINTMIFSRSGGSEGIGFAVPSSITSKVYAQLVKGGKVTRAYLGVFLSDVTPALARTAGYDGKGGALVQDLSGAATPAARAGLRSGDLIVEFDGKPVTSSKQLTEAVANTSIDKRVEVKFIRDGRPQTATIALAERPRAGAPEPPPAETEGEDGGRLGISVSTVTPQIAAQMKLKIQTGVIIENVEADSPAQEAGLSRGMVIHRVNRMPVTNRQELINALNSFQGEKEIVLQIETEGRLFFATVSFE